MLLILAGVSISLVVGDNGVLTQASTASKNTSVAEAKEKVEQAVSSLQGQFVNTWSGDTTKFFMKDGISQSTLQAELNNAGYELKYTGNSDATSATVSSTGSIKVNGEYYWFKLTGTSNQLGATIQWNTKTSSSGTTEPVGGEWK